jgi:hypothetical protein
MNSGRDFEEGVFSPGDLYGAFAADCCSSRNQFEVAFLISKDPSIPVNATPAERIKAGVKDPVRSAIFPATGGARACPMLKIKMVNPSAAGAMREPTESPTAAATMEGMDQAVRPKRMVEIRYPELDFNRPKMR